MTHFCKSSYCFIGNQQIDVTKYSRQTKQLWYKKLAYRASGVITRRGTGKEMPSALLSSEENKEPQSHEVQHRADNLHHGFAPAR
jgi:UPF0288 family protein (methanogenesis marker protein 3)